ADGDVEIGGDDLAGLADLPIVGGIIGIDGGAGGADGGAESFAKFFNQLEAFGRTDRDAAADHDLGGGEVRDIALGAVGGDELCGRLYCVFKDFHRRGIARGGGGEGRGAEREHVAGLV